MQIIVMPAQSITLTQPDSLKTYIRYNPPFCPDKPDGEITTTCNGGVKEADYYYRWSDNSTNSELVKYSERIL